MLIITQVWLVTSLLQWITFTNTLQESGTRGNYFRPTNFPDVLSEKYYIDKSLLIKEILDDESNATLVTAPKGFFKTMNTDMVKRFLEIEVDDKGEEKLNKSNTRNYKLFSNLNIYKNFRDFFYQHFGKYPVVHIDYSPLNGITSYEDLLQKFKQILVKTFVQHKYLMETEKLWITEGSKMVTFNKYIDKELNRNLSMYGVEHGFEFLCHILHSHFEKRVFVLIDEYDAFVDSFIFKGVNYADDIVKSMQSVHGHLLKLSSKGVVRIFLTGIFHTSDQILSAYTNVIRNYLFLRNHRYGQYFGITNLELENILRNNMLLFKETDIDNLKVLISKHFGGYTLIRKYQELFNPCSVISYLSSKILKTYCSLPDHKEFFARLFYNAEVKKGIISLLQNATLSLDISRPLLIQDILLLKNEVEYATYNVSGNLSHVAFKLTFDLGYLSINHGTQCNKNVVSVSLPNLETENYFASVLQDLIMQKYDTNVSCIDFVNNIIHAVSVHNSSEDTFMILHESFCNIFRHSSYTVEDESDFQNDLFSIFRYKSRHVYTNFEKERVGSIDVVLRNENNVSFIIETNIKGKENLRYCTKAAVDKMIQKKYINILEPEFKKYVVYLGLCYSKKDRNFGLGYAKSINQGDDLNKIAYLLLSV